jgi:hypothetical protein
VASKTRKKTDQKRSAKAAAGGDNGTASSPERKPISAEALPRRSLEQAIEYSRVLRQIFAGKAVTVGELAKAMSTTKTSDNFRYGLWSAVAYGVVTAEEGPNKSRRYSLAETGRKIVAENIPGEAQEAKIKAVLTPTILSKFFTDYNGNPIPPTDEHFANVLEDRFNVPRDRTKEAIEIIASNGKWAGILQAQGEGKPPIVRLSGVPVSEQLTTGETGSVIDQGVTPATSWDKTCFYITPLGDDNTEERRHSNMMLKHLVRPAFDEHGFTVVRADEIAKTGIITQQIFEHLAKSRVCVADMSFRNPNAFYELGVRHAFLLPTIQLIHRIGKIPFDVSQGRTITVDTGDSYTVTDHLESARKTLSEYVKNLIAGNSGSEDNPVAIYLPGIRVIIPS